jgi:hypothetical protein
VSLSGFGFGMPLIEFFSSELGRAFPDPKTRQDSMSLGKKISYLASIAWTKTGVLGGNMSFYVY